MIIMWGILISVLMGLYGLMILRFMRGWRLFAQGPSMEMNSRMDHEKPGLLLTVVVAARNEALRMRPLLDALAAQDFGLTYKGRWEVVWVDDESTDGSAKLVEDFAREHPHLLWRVLRRDGSDSYPSHKKGAVAMGIAAAQGEWIMVTDADCVPGLGWCSAMTAALAGNPTVEFVAGPVRLAPCGSLWQKSQAVEFMSLNAIAASSIALGQPIISNGGNMAFRRGTVLALNPYADNMNHPGGDDDLLMHRIVLAFGPAAVVFCSDPRAMVDTPPVGALRNFLQQRIRWVSKQSAYPDPWVSGILKAVWLMQALIAVGLLASFRGGSGLVISWICLGAWCIKGWLDGIFTRRAAGFYRIRADWSLLVLTQLWYLPYTLYAGFMGYRGQFEWKGRAYKT